MNTTKTWKRLVSILLAVVLMLSIAPVGPYMDIRTNAATATTVYMKPNSNWTTDSARFAAYFFNSSGNTWVSMTDSDGDGIYEASVPSGYTSVIFCRMNPSYSTNSWDYKWNQTGDLTVPTTYNVLYTISGWDSGSWGTMSYSVSYSLTNITKSGNSTAKYGTNYTATLTAGDGYELPSSITVKAGSATLTSGTGYTYDSSTGAITVYGAYITGKLTITAAGTEAAASTYAITFSGTNVTSSGASTVEIGSQYTATLTAASGYNLPSSITVKSGSTTLTAGTGYTYDSSTGALTVYADYITDDLTITASGIKIYTVAGNSELTGVSWDPTSNPMTYNSDGTYSITFGNVAAGSHAFKVTNGSWNENYGGSGDNADSDGNYIFTLEIESNVTITFDPDNGNAITVLIEEISTSYSVTFNGTNVESSGGDTAYSTANYTATLTIPSGYHFQTLTVVVGSTTLSDGYSFNETTGLLTIERASIYGNITITAVAEADYYIVAGTSGITGSEWNTTDTSNMMTLNDDGTYSITFTEVASGTHEFKVVLNGSWNNSSWPSDGTNYVLSVSSTSDVTVTFDPSTGNISVTTVGVKEDYDRMDEVTLNPDSVFYVDTDIVDYLNDNRVANGQVYGYYTDNQGIWDNAGDAPYSYLNHLISMQAGTYNLYTYPMYFGSLISIASRYSRIVNSNTYYSLSKWNSAISIALADTSGNLNVDAAVQGLVGSDLVNGNLADPSTGSELLYFNKEAADTWTNPGGEYPVMAYYADLQFPFVMTYDTDSRVTTYSYDSASDYAVYYDYSSSQLYASNTHILDGDADGDTSSTDYGFYPLNEPDDSGNEINNGFGIKFSIDFTVGEDGLLANGEPVTFNFTGDDDVWVFIDGKLVLDMGGAHGKASGSIDFYNKTATVADAYTVASSLTHTSGNSYTASTYNNRSNSWLYNYIDGSATEERAAVTAGEKSVSFTDLGISDFDYSAIHTMTVFYMERGMGESNFSMNFTMVPVPSGLTLSKELNDAAINKGLLDEISAVSDFNFAFSATSPSSTSVAFQNYTLTEKNSGMATVMTPRATETDGTFSTTIHGITNYTYAHSFYTSSGEHAFIPGTKFDITESLNNVFTYTTTTWAVYDAKNSYSKVTEGTDMTAAFTMGKADDTTAYSYAVVFTNTMALGDLQIKKEFADTTLSNTVFTFNVYLDLDGDGTAFEEALYTGLVYTVDGGDAITSTDGTVSLQGGQTATIAGIPAGATYRVEEVIPDDAPWQLDESSNTSGTITVGQTVTATFVNSVIKHGIAAKFIYVEAGTPTSYALTYNNQSVTVTGLSSISDGLSVEISNGSVIVTGAEAGTVYTFEYSGRLPSEEIAYGIINVYTFAAADHVYVFDFGLPSDLAAINSNNDGLFQGGCFYNSNVSGESPILAALTADSGNTQTTVTTTLGGSISTDGSYSAAVTFRPVAFMSKVETYTYTVQITAYGQTYDASNPETGTTVTGTITVMPANAVYYEDNFNVTDTDNKPAEEIIYSANGPTADPTLSQSNDQSGNYGYDEAYTGGYTQSNGTSTTLTNGQYGYFTFSGTGFDLISRTNGSTAGFAVYVFAGEHKAANITYMSSFSGASPTDMVFVDTYYNNGDLYQVPVASVRLDSYGTYTVYIQALATSTSLTSVSIDGIRIYDPLEDTSLYPLAAEQNTTVEELRVLYGVDGIVSLAGRGSNGVFNGLGKADAVYDAMANASIVENMDGEEIITAADLTSIYLYGPNNEMYLPTNFGISFSYKVTDTNWTLQIGAKAVTATNAAKSFTVYVKNSSSSTYSEVGTVTLSSATDMYYDLTDLLGSYCSSSYTYDIIIISDSAYESNEFVSLTTVKHSGVTLS